MSPKITKYTFLGIKKRKRICFVSTLIVSLFFIFYQFFMYYLVSNENPFTKSSVPANKEHLVRGTHLKEIEFYKPFKGMFTCIKSLEEIDFNKVNDNYCDCADSTDEPGTSACADGVFYCTISSNKNHQKMIPSSKVNDGICDCCDGSDEYKNNDLIKNFNRIFQAKTRHFLVPCPNTC